MLPLALKLKRLFFSYKAILIVLAACIYGCKTSNGSSLSLVDYNCDFSYRDQIKKPQGFKYESLSGALAWINKKVYGQLTQGVGKDLYQEIEGDYWRDAPPGTTRLKIWGVGQNVTFDGVAYLVIYEGDSTTFTMVKIPEADVERFQIRSDSVTSLFTHQCKS